jgi:hypothetical protein
LFDRPKPTVGCSADGRRRSYPLLVNARNEWMNGWMNDWTNEWMRRNNTVSLEHSTEDRKSSASRPGRL